MPDRDYKGESSRSSAHEDEGWRNLMRKAQDGDPIAYAELLTAASDPIRGFIRRHFPSIRDVEDVVQESLITLHKVRHTFDPGRPFLPWLFALVRYRSLDHIRRQARIRTHEVTYEDPLEQLPDVRSDTDSMNRETAAEMINRLPDKEKTIIKMLKIDQMSVKDVAKTTGFSESNVKVIASRGYARLRQQWSKRA